MSPVLISLSPNTEADDLRQAWRVLLKPRQWRQETFVIHLEQLLSRYFDNRPVVMTSSGRAGIKAALSALSIGEGDEVIVQAFTCISVPAAVNWAGAKPRFADIDPTTYNFDISSLANKINLRTKAIIVQHTFGIPGPLQQIRQLADKHNLVIIEDLAHSLGATLDGQKLGTFGDIAVLSFGRDKGFSSVFGGALVSNNPDLIKKINQQQNALPYPPRWWVAQQLIHPLLISLAKTWYWRGHVGQVIIVSAQKLGLLSKAVQLSERRAKEPQHTAWRYSPALARLLNLQLSKIARYTKRRQHAAQQYRQTLGITTKQLVDSPGASWLRFPLRVPDKAKVLASAKQAKLVLGDWYDSPVTPCAGLTTYVGYRLGSCPVAEQASRETINLPTYPTIRPDQLQQVISFIRSQAS